MSVDLPAEPELHDVRLTSLQDRDLAERLASLEDRDLAERLFLENPALFSDEPPQTERQVLAWTTRRFGTLVLAVTAAASIAAGYLLTPLMRDRSPAAVAPAPRTAIAVPVSAALAHRSIPSPHHVVRSAPVQKHAAAQRHAVYAPPVVPAVPHPHRILRRAPVAPAPAEHEAALREKIRAQQAEIARLRAQAAAEAAAAHAARVRAAQAATQTQARPRTAPASGPATSTATTTGAETSRPGAGTANVPVDTNAGPPDSGVRTPPAPPRGGWSEHPPIPGPLGGVLGPRDSCTPSGGRMGAVINAILDSGLVRTNIRL